MNIFTWIISGLLSLDTIRALIAMTGWVKPKSKYSWIIYGRYERNLIVSALKELGFQEKKSERILNNLRHVSVNERDMYGITKDNVIEQLVILISRYIVHFNQPIQYGGRQTTTSSYYIDTMEMSHNEKDKQLMVSIMAFLYAYHNNSTKPQVVITPKGGNPLFAQAVAKYYGATFIVAKSSNEKSRITSGTDDPYTYFRINYECAWNVASGANAQECIIVDCNTSGGSQLIDIIHDIRGIFHRTSEVKISPPNKVYVLFRADNGPGHDVDKKFKDNQCELYRFFDLDEDIKARIYRLKESAGDERVPDLYYSEDKQQVDEIIDQMKEKGLCYYDP